jgi:hypothetical protein
MAEKMAAYWRIPSILSAIVAFVSSLQLKADVVSRRFCGGNKRRMVDAVKTRGGPVSLSRVCECMVGVDKRESTLEASEEGERREETLRRKRG